MPEGDEPDSASTATRRIPISAQWKWKSQEQLAGWYGAVARCERPGVATGVHGQDEAMGTRWPSVQGATLDASQVGAGRILEAWREATEPLHATWPLSPAGDFDASIHAYNLDGLVVSRLRFGASYLERCPPLNGALEARGVMLQRHLSGSARGVIGDHELYLAPDRISLQDLTAPYSVLAETSEVLTVAIPRERLPNADRLRATRPTLPLPLGEARGSFLAGCLERLWEELCAGRVTEPVTLALAFLGLLDGLLASSGGAGHREPGSVAMEQYLRDHLTEPDLGVDHLRRAFHCSRSSVYRAFEAHGGVAAFIRSERLRRCHAALIRPGPPPAIAAVAGHYGFHDSSRFSRVFRRQFGLAPSQVVARAPRTGPAAPLSQGAGSVAANGTSGRIAADRGTADDGLWAANATCGVADDHAGARTIRSWLSSL